MTLTDKEREWISKAPSFREHLMEELQDPEYRAMWLQASLEDFLANGDIDMFINTLTKVVMSQSRGEITRLAKELKIDRSNLSEIINGKTKPQLSTVLKLINGLGYDYEIKLKQSEDKKKPA